MKRTPTLIIFLAALATAGVAFLAIHKYEGRKVAAIAKPVNYQALYKSTQESNKMLTVSNGVLQATNTQLVTQKGQLCTDLKAHKLIDPLCN